QFILISFVAGPLLISSCKRSQPQTVLEKSQEQSIVVPAELRATVEKLTHAVENYDIPHILEAYADDFVSGTGRSKDSINEVFSQLRENRVKLQVEKLEFEKIEGDEARLRTQLRLRYRDQFRDLGEGEVVVTDVLRHSLRKEDAGWRIYTDER